MKKSFLFILVFVTVMLSAQYASSETFTVSSTIYPTFSQPEPLPMKGNGVLYDITVAAYTATGSDVVIKFMPMARIAWSVVEKKYDGTLGTINWFTRLKTEHLVESVDLVTANISLFYLKNRFPLGVMYNELSDLKEYKFGSLYGSSTLPLFKKAGIKADLVAELDQNFKKLDAGRIDLTVAIDLTGWTVIDKLFPNQSDQFATIKKPLLPIHTSIIFLKNSHALSVYKRGLGIILENGTFHDIVMRYYGTNVDYSTILPPPIFQQMKKKPTKK